MEHVAITFTTARGQALAIDKRVAYHRVNRSWLLRKLVSKGLDHLTDEEIEQEIKDDPKSLPKAWSR